MRKQFPQLEPCEIGEYVGVNLALKGVVYNIFISSYKQKIYCAFCCDRNNKERDKLNIKEDMDKVQV